jgi:hypothetical protein
MNKGGVIGYEPYYWGEVLEEINKIRGYDNIHDGDNSANGER